jgi:hypothetical protein
MSTSSRPDVDSEDLPGFVGAWIGKIVVALVAAVTLVCVVYALSGSRMFAGSGLALPLVSLVVAALFAAAPLLACFAHTISIDRQKEKLDGLVLPKIKETQYFKTAKGSLESVRPASVKQPDFFAPMLFFAVIVIFCSLVSFMALFTLDAFEAKSTLLGGLRVLQETMTKEQIVVYQSGTLVVSAVAFIGAYLALFNRLLNQINNNDIYPISFHYLCG